MHGSNELVDAPVAPLVRRIAVPAATGYLFNTFYNIVDSVYAGLWSTAALAALGASFPVFFIVIALMFGLGQGATALMARALGAGDPDRARALADQAMLLAVLAGVAVAGIGVAVAGPVLAPFRLEGDALVYAHAYLIPILCAAPLFLVNAVANGRLAAQGDTRTYRNALVVGAVANVAINPLLMFGLGLGIAGIAWATVLIQMATLVYMLARTRRDRLGGKPVRVGPDWRLWQILARQSLPAAGNMALIGVSLFIITGFVARHGEAAVAAYSVALRVEQLFLLPTVGLNAAGVTLIGNAFGAGRYERITDILRTCVLWGLVIMGAGTVVIFLLREPLMLLFTRDPAVLSVGTQYLAIAALIQCAYVFTMMGNAALQGIGQPIWGFAVALGRSLVGPLVLLWLVDIVLGLGLSAIFWTLLAINWTAAAVTILLVRHRLRVDCGLRLNRVAPA